MFKRILSLVLALVMVLGGVPMAFADEADTTPTEIQWLVDNGYVTGYPDGTLGLDKAITRAEVATIMVKAFDYLDTAKALENIVTFQDVYAQAKWANGYVNALAAKKIASGYLDGTFKPNNEITNAEVAAFMVKAIDGKQPEGPWPAAVVARANELGLFKGVENTVANAKATRQDTFMMIYNALMEMEIGNYSIVKGIVLENYRVESIDKDEIVVEIIRPIQKADYADESRLEEGDQLELTVPADVADVEELLGKVADFTINEKNEVVKVKVDDSYKYLQGEIEASRKKLEVDGDTYTVELDERYKDSDERIFRTYHNNKDYSYDDFYDEVKEAEFARVTVKNGKVLFIDAFDFDDIAPVAKVDDEVVYFDDTKDGELDELDEAEYVLVYEDGKLGVGSFEDIEANDVIHFYEDDNEDLTVVVSSIIVEGEYEEANAARARDKEDLNIVVDDEEYPAVLTESRTPVYSTTMDIEDFFALSEDYDLDLEPFEEKEVVVLLDMFGNVQLIGSAEADDTFYAVVTNTTTKEDMKLLRADGEEEWYETSRDTKYSGEGITKGMTQTERFNEFAKNDFVSVIADGDLIKEINRYKKNPIGVTDIDEDEIILASKDDRGLKGYHMSKNVVLFVNYEEVMDIDTFLEDYIDPSDDEYEALENKLKAQVMETSNRDKEVARIIIIENAELEDEEIDTLVVKVRDVVFTGGNYFLRVQYGNGETGRHDVDEDINIRNVEKGDFLILTVTDDDDQIVTDFEYVDWDVEAKEVAEYSRSTDRKEGFIEFTDKTRVRIAKGADVFGDPEKGDYVAYRYKEGATLKIVDIVAVVAKPEDTTPTGLVTYINTTDNTIMIDDELLEISITSKLYNEVGVLMATGSDILGKLTQNVSKVFDVDATNGIVKSMKLVAADADRLAAKAVIDEINALDSTKDTFATDVQQARTNYDELSKEQKDLVTNLAKLEAAEKAVKNADYAAKLENATKAVEKAEASQSLTDVKAAKKAITDADLNATDKKALEDRVAAIVIKVKDAAELNAALKEKVNAIEFTADITADITINDEVTIDGAGKTLTGGIIVSADDVTIKNLTVKDSTEYGVQFYVVEGALLKDVTIVNSHKGGVLVNGAEVEVVNVVLKNNAWGGIEVSQGKGVTTAPKLMVSGLSHDDVNTPAIWIDGALVNQGWVNASGYKETVVPAGSLGNGKPNANQVWFTK